MLPWSNSKFPYFNTYDDSQNAKKNKKIKIKTSCREQVSKLIILGIVDYKANSWCYVSTICIQNILFNCNH